MNTMNRDANNEAAQTLASMFAGTTIAKTSASCGTITLTIADGDTVTIRHETRTHDILGETRAKKTGTGGGITLRARDAIDNSSMVSVVSPEPPSRTTRSTAEPSPSPSQAATPSPSATKPRN